MAFAAQAYIASPLTLDHDFLLRNLDRLELGLIDESRTAIGSALATAVNRLRELKSKSRIVILMTDGQNNAGKIDPLVTAEAARSLGASPWTAFRKITLRLIAPGISAGSIFAFIVSFGQFETTLFLTVPNHEPLPMAMYISLRYKFEPTAAAAGIFAIALVALSTVISARLVSLRRVFRA